VGGWGSGELRFVETLRFVLRWRSLPFSRPRPCFLPVTGHLLLAGGAYMLLFGMCATSERPPGAGPSDRNSQSRWLLNGARGQSDYCGAVLAPPHFTSPAYPGKLTSVTLRATLGE